MPKPPTVPISPVEGLQHGRLTLISRTTASDPRVLKAATPPSYLDQGALWECHCSCGAICFYSNFALKKGKIKSCGCLRRSKIASKATTRVPNTELRVIRDSMKIQRGKHMHARMNGNGQAENEAYEELVRLYNRKRELEIQIKTTKIQLEQKKLQSGDTLPDIE